MPSDTALLLLSIPVALSVVHVFGQTAGVHLHKQADTIRSFAGGFSVAYVFLILLPEIPSPKEVEVVDIAIVALLGFAMFHEAHNYIFKKSKSSRRKSLIDAIHLLTAGSYSFLITFFLVELTKVNVVEGVIVSVIIAIHFILSEITHSKDVHRAYKLPIIIASTMAGGLMAVFGLADQLATDVLFALTTGALVYIAIREEIPRAERGKPLFFMVGVFILILVRAFLL